MALNFPFVLRSTYDAMTADRDRMSGVALAWEQALRQLLGVHASTVNQAMSLKLQGAVPATRSAVADPARFKPPEQKAIEDAEAPVIRNLVAQLRKDAPQGMTDEQLEAHARELLAAHNGPLP